MVLKLLGTIQAYDLPYLLLYIDKVSNGFYVAFRLSIERKPVCDYLLTSVSVQSLVDYLNQEITMRELFNRSDRIYLWHKQRGVKGGIFETENLEMRLRVDNSKYNPVLCEDENIIKHYILNR